MNADNPMEVMAYAQNNGGPRADCGKPNDEYWCDVAKWYASKLDAIRKLCRERIEDRDLHPYTTAGYEAVLEVLEPKP